MHKSNYIFTEGTTKFCTPEQATKRYHLTRQVIVEIAKEGGALLKIGRSTRIDVDALDRYLRKEYTI